MPASPDCLRAVLVFVFVLVIAGPRPAPAESVARARSPRTCSESVARWQLGRGELFADNACGSFLLTTDAENHASSIGEASFKTPVRIPYEVSLRWRRLGPEGDYPMWIRLLGGHLFVRDGALTLWLNAAQQAGGGYQPVPGLESHREHLIAIAQSSTQIEVRIDGALVRTLPFAATLRSGPLAVGLNGARGYRSFMAFRDFSVRGSGQ